MSSVAFDTHAYVKQLKSAGMPEEQAEVLAQSHATLIDKELATKRDVEGLAAATKRDVEGLAAATKRDMEEFRAVYKREMEALAAATKRDMEEFRAVYKRELEEFRAAYKRDMGRVWGDLQAGHGGNGTSHQERSHFAVGVDHRSLSQCRRRRFRHDCHADVAWLEGGCGIDFPPFRPN